MTEGSIAPLLAWTEIGKPSSVALVSFLAYLAGVFLLAWWSSRTRAKQGFIDEFFLGNRNLGVWALALTFAATSASGGSFVGFPALVYTHGWVLALWISGYMVVPLVAMGLLGKRLNLVSRRSGAITIPEVLGERFASPAARLVATLLIVVFIFYYLLAQFKAGSEILASLLHGVPLYDQAVNHVAVLIDRLPLLQGSEPDYVLCLAVFAAAVILYVVYGGFRAVVWTDVMQGAIMFAGVVLMLVLVLRCTGGLPRATRELARRIPPVFAQAQLVSSSSRGGVIDKGTWVPTGESGLVRTAQRCEIARGDKRSQPIEVLELTCAADRQAVPREAIREDLRAEIFDRREYAYGAGSTGVYLQPPGPDPHQPYGFLSLAMALSFFVFWPFAGAGQPANMVRLMAFRNTKTLRWSIITVSLYFSVIYFSLVIIFCCARVILPGMEIAADRVMPEMAVYTTAWIGHPWLAGLLLAAPFAAVMSSVDSFLLLVSSSLVRDIYQKYLHPAADELRLKRITHLGTCVVGLLATVAALHPPKYLQEIIVVAGGGLAASLLVPVAFALYWKRMTAAGAVAGMLAGCLTHSLLSFGGIGWDIPLLRNLLVLWHTMRPFPQISMGWLQAAAQLGLEPFLWDLLVSAAAVLLFSYGTPRPSQPLVDKFFP